MQFSNRAKNKKYSLKKNLLSILTLFMVLIFSIPAYADDDFPRLNMGYIFTTHHTPFMIAMAKNNEFKDNGIWLETVIEKEKYDLVKNGKTIARLNILVSKSGSETATLFAQKRLDIGISSITAMMTGIDRGADIKVLSPMHVDGLGLVFPKDSKINGWNDLVKHIKSLKRPLKLGYHSPTSAPRIVIEGALKEAGFKVSSNPNDFESDILLVDLKTTRNLIPALAGKQVDCWVGPAPYPEVAEVKHMGHIALDLSELPPEGKWKNFPCCTLGARSEIISKHPEVVKSLVSLIKESAEWSNKNREQMGEISGNWLGIPPEAVKKSRIVYTTTPSENWLRGVSIYMDILNKTGKFSNSFKDKKLSEVEKELFDFRFVN
ncbi:MAG: ABC transporter substrate-binding protein [Desulfobacteraceae bacterium]|nr:ABC transporter substrate-binding protein [Desulfobacteraceae bacterium]